MKTCVLSLLFVVIVGVTSQKVIVVDSAGNTKSTSILSPQKTFKPSSKTTVVDNGGNNGGEKALSSPAVPAAFRLNRRQPFCPLERNENRCRSRRNQFKCGVFFMDLDGQTGGDGIRWLGALPDFLLKPSVRRSPKMLKTFAGLHKKSFRTIPGFCNEHYANAQCYNLMSKISSVPLDGCSQSLLNEYGDRTLGDILCEKAGRFAPGQHFQSFVKIGFYHSACGGDWTETHKRGKHLQLEEELCCKYDTGKGQFFRCTGGEFASTCDEATLLPRRA